MQRASAAALVAGIGGRAGQRGTEVRWRSAPSSTPVPPPLRTLVRPWEARIEHKHPVYFLIFFRVPSILKIRVCCILRCASAGKVPVFYMKSFLCVPKFYTKGASVYANGARQVLMLLHKGISDFLNHISKEEKKHRTNFAICSRVVSTKG